MKNQKLIVNLINAIENIFDNYYNEDDLYFNPDAEILLNEFSDKLVLLFKDGVDNQILEMINKLEYKNIFKIKIGDRYINNNIRIQIEKYLLENEELYLDFNIIRDNIKENYKLAKYLREKNKIIELIDLNEKVFLLLEGKYATKELINKYINKSDIIAKIFLGIYGNDNDIFIYSKYYQDIEDIDNILFNKLKDILKENPLLYINSSDIIKENKFIQNYIVSLDSRMKSYI